jgi:phosphatidylserine/phosphatidylglycerophosphate/cardiolipin synthase-like enzyme/uncharacterized membrane protein YdjX (TVP38/TMEM64 family)
VAADRVAVLVDADAYFRAFTAAVERAERSILILGWDIDSRTLVRREDDPSDLPRQLGPFLSAIVARRPGLHAHVLSWDYSTFFLLERELLPVYHMGWRTHRRVHFRLDDDHPTYGAQHQKVVVIDDAVAFSGGLDLCTHRWDTPAHAAFDPGRRTPGGEPYQPFHDVQLAVSGPAAAALGDLVRERWHRLTGQRLRPPPPPRTDPWPPTLQPELTDAAIGIARTEPRYRGRPAVREVETLFRDMIAAAERFIYCESQYLTSAVIGAALAARLAEPHGPEVVLVGPVEASGWLEQATIGLLRGRLVRRLEEADHHGRLRLYYPVVPGGAAPTPVFVHSKVFIIDDDAMRVGSANLSNRSMGVDSECDLVIAAAGDPRVRAAVAAFRDRLLGEHLGVAPAAVAAALARERSLIRAIERLSGRPRTLVALELRDVESIDGSTALFSDPEQPVDVATAFQTIVPREVRRRAERPVLRTAAVLVALAALAGAWRWTALRHWIEPAHVAALLETYRLHPIAPLVVIGAYVAGGALMVPVNLLILGTALAFGPLLGPVYSLLGALASATATYWAGRLLGRGAVRRLAGSRLGRLGRHLARRGVLTMTAVHLLPIAPFTIVNLVAGASRLRFGSYLAGTALGMLPGILLLGLVGDRLAHLLRAPSARNLAAFIALGVLLATALLVGALGLRRLRRRRAAQAARILASPAPLPQSG